MPNWLTKYIAKQFAPAIGSELSKVVQPKVTEVPSQMMLGYPMSGGIRRKQGGVVDFDTLRSFSVVYDVARACINHRKRQIANLEWAIVPKDDEEEPEEYKRKIEEITTFFEEPCHQTDFKTFTDRIIEDLLVLDAAVLWKDVTYGRKVKELLPVDGSTIRLKVTQDGTLPEPPEVAYQQVIYGQLHGEYTTDEMIYKIMNPRTNTPYGLSPLECLIIGVDSALRSQLYNANLLSEGTVPEGFFGVPATWTPEQIKDYQTWFDAIMAGNFQNSSRIKFMPGGKGVGYIPTKKPEDMRFLEFEKWLLLKTCAVFDVQPEDIGFIENMTRATGETQQQAGAERGLIPMANFIKSIYTKVIAEDFGAPQLKFEWKGLQVVDDEFELDRNVKMLQNGALTINEWRVAQGLDPLKEEAADKPMIFSIGTPTLLEMVGKEPEETEEGEEVAPAQEADEEELEEVDKWEKKCLNALKAGRKIPEFRAEKIATPAQVLIRAGLSKVKTKEEVRAVFRPFKQEMVERSLVSRALQVRRDIGIHRRTKYERIGSRT